MKKKKEYVFTIAFDCDNPNHVITAKKLNSLGRKKAGYIAKAVIAYLNSTEKTIEPNKLPEHHNNQSQAVSTISSNYVCKEVNGANDIDDFMSNLSDFG